MVRATLSTAKLCSSQFTKHDGKTTTSAEVVNKQHENFSYVANRNILHNELFGNYSIDDSIRFMVLKKLMVQLSWGQDGTMFSQLLPNLNTKAATL